MRIISLAVDPFRARFRSNDLRQSARDTRKARLPTGVPRLVSEALFSSLARTMGSDVDTEGAAPAQLLTPPSTHPSSPEPAEVPDVPPPRASKKKKKKKAKKTQAPATLGLPPPLYISRMKHWRQISAFHASSTRPVGVVLRLTSEQGPWLQLPIELLESLMVINTDPATLRQDRYWHLDHAADAAGLPLRLSQRASSDSTRVVLSASPAFTSAGDAPAPPPIDPGIFRSLVAIRRLVDDASELSVRAASGLSTAALRGPSPLRFMAYSAHRGLPQATRRLGGTYRCPRHACTGCARSRFRSSRPRIAQTRSPQA
jgi:hypothetical protein